MWGQRVAATRTVRAEGLPRWVLRHARRLLCQRPIDPGQPTARGRKVRLQFKRILEVAFCLEQLLTVSRVELNEHVATPVGAIGRQGFGFDGLFELCFCTNGLFSLCEQSCCTWCQLRLACLH